MGRGSVGVSAKQGTGPKVTLSPGKGTTTSTFKPDVASERSMKASSHNSQKTTTAPTVKMPAITMVTDTKPRTAREKAVDAYNADANSYRTALERQYAQIAEAEKNAGSQAKMVGRPKQAQ